MDTKRITQWMLSNKDAQKIGVDASFEKMVVHLEEMIQKEIFAFVNNVTVMGESRPLVNALNDCFNEVENEFNSDRWISLTDEVYFDKKANGCWVIRKKDENNPYQLFDRGTPVVQVNDYLNKTLKDPINKWEVPSKETLLKMLNLDSNTPFEIDSSHRCINYNYINSWNQLYVVEGEVCGNHMPNKRDSPQAAGVCVPFLDFKASMPNLKVLFLEFLDKGLTPLLLENSLQYKLLLSIVHRKQQTLFPECKLEDNQIVKELITEKIPNSLLLEDYIRADIAPYQEKILEDTELGHWSLWTEELESDAEQVIDLPTPMVARDPKSSINDGVVAIDFGTKSTVVVYQKDNVNIHPMRIGTGDLSKDIQAHHYENPTIMEFRDLDAFIGAYSAKANKPYTRWQDLTISHTAKNALEGTDSSKFNTFLDEIKQWAGDKNRKLKVVGQQGKVIDLPPFLELTEDDFNPIEIYAYFLGLYINNLNNGIFMDYILSFPVTYEMPVRDKIIESFERGIKKSLPSELGADAIEHLTVTKGASEPAAYALTAFKAHNFDPVDDEHIFYGVFDFGGGTTDFDFGIFREAQGAKERRFDYVIEHFGAGGDKFLGGENLLELLAFEVFKKNRVALLEAGIQFEKHPEKDAFAGSEQLLSYSQEAKNNTKKLCIALRPFWEEYDDFSIDSSDSLSITLTDSRGIQHSAFNLVVDEEELRQLLSDRIERGVENFFDALRLAFSHSEAQLNGIENVNIFLAGNSSQSSYVTALFEKHIALQDEEIGSVGQSHFKLFAPLGADKTNIEKPTGKTGVAFGLIESREGGNIKVIDRNVSGEDIRFKYYLGENRKGKFKPIVDRENNFNEWIEFIDAGYPKFELYYSEQPTSSTGNVLAADDSIKKKSIKLDLTDDDAMVYIKIISPTQIEYVIADEQDIKNNIYLNEPQSIEL